MPQFRFLQQPTNEIIRKQIQNIDDSYTHPWDILAELSQNAVDAVREHVRLHGEGRQQSIEITIDRSSRSIRFRDSGVGIPPDLLSVLLAPHGSSKVSRDGQIIGQKGVGLTYAIFKCDFFEITTQSEEGFVRGHIRNAASWKNGMIDEMPVLEIDSENCETASSSQTYTDILLGNVEPFADSSEDLFDLEEPVVQALLRTRTAIGSTRVIFKLQPDAFLVTLTITGDESRSFTVPSTYLLPENLIEQNQFLDIADYDREAPRLDDRQRGRMLQGKCLRKVGAETRAGRSIRYYAFFAPSRKIWKEINLRNQLRTEEQVEASNLLYHDGIFIATRGMPTGIQLPHPATKLAGNWPQMFILLEDDSLTFDLGRKSIPGRTQGVLKEIAKDLFDQLTELAQYMSTDPSVTTPLLAANRDIFFSELEALPELSFTGIPYEKLPWSQEAAVAAMFNQLLGAGILKGYTTLACGYKMSYDWWGLYAATADTVGANQRTFLRGESTDLRLVIEFKYAGESILNDLESNKHFHDIDLIVCWDLSEERFARERVQVRPVRPEDSLYHGTNYEIEWPGALNLGHAGKKQVIALRRLFDDLARGSRTR